MLEVLGSVTTLQHSRLEASKMIKRRFYRLERGDKESGSDSSSFSSDSEVDTEVSAESEDDVAAEVSEDDSLSERKEEDDDPSSDSSGPLNADTHNDDDNTKAGVDDDDDSDNDGYRERVPKTELSSGLGLDASDTKFDTMDEKELDQDIPDCMIRCKSVFKCRYCPNIICLNEATMLAHVASKKHARAERLLKQGKFKTIDSDGEVDNQEITEGTHAVDTTSVQEKQRKGSKRSRRQRKMSQKREKESTKHEEKGAVVQKPKKKRRQTKD